MARDLIPPPSPAGRPLPDGAPRPEGAPRFIELPPEPAPVREEELPLPPPSDLPPSRFRNRFGFLIGALAGVVLALVVVLGVAISSSSGGSDDTAGEGLAVNWSGWKPSDTSASGGASEIAKHVGAEYKLTDGAQLTHVIGSTVPIGGSGLHVAVRPQTGDVQELKSGSAIIYVLDGLGPMGSIKGGTPSVQRQRLVRREALELSLYSFRYLHGVDTVVTLLPPALPVNNITSSTTEEQSPTSVATITTKDTRLLAVVYRPGDLKQELQVPLHYTLSPATPNPDTAGLSTEGKRVDQLTLSNMFDASFVHAQNLLPYLVLDRAELK